MFTCWVGWDNGLAATLGEPIPEFAGVVGAVGDQFSGRGNTLQESACANEIMGVAWRNREGDRSALLIGQRVNFSRPSAARASDRLDEVPPFAPAAERCALTCVESIDADKTTPLEPVSA